MKSLVWVGIVTITASLLMALTMDALADRDDHPKKGNNGQCWKLQKELDLGGTKEECHDSFTGKDHNDDEPLP